MTGPSGRVELLVCTKCRHGAEVPEDATRPGTLLYERWWPPRRPMVP